MCHFLNATEQGINLRGKEIASRQNSVNKYWGYFGWLFHWDGVLDFFGWHIFWGGILGVFRIWDGWIWYRMIWSIWYFGYCIWSFHHKNIRICVYILWINLAKSSTPPLVTNMSCIVIAQIFKSEAPIFLLGRCNSGTPVLFKNIVLVIGSLRSVCIRLYARDRGGDCSLEEPLPTAKRNA